MRINMRPTSVIKARLGLQKGGPVHKFFTDTCYKHMDKYVPFADGNLASNVAFGANGDSIIYLSPYAHYMYEGKVMGPNIPFKDKNGNIIKWRSPKGKPKYYTGAEINYSTQHHEFAGSHWDKRMWSAEKDKVIEEVEDYIKKHGGK